MHRPVRIVGWTLVAVFVILLIEFPRGLTPLPMHSGVRSRLVTFSWQQYGRHLAVLWHRLVTLSIGDTVDGRSIDDVLSQSIGSSLVLVAIGMIFVVVIGISKGIYDGWKTYSTSTGTVASGTIQWLAESIPDFFLIFTLELFGFYLNRLGIPLYFVGSHQFISGTLIPAVILAMLPSVYMARMIRLTVEDQLGQQYLVTAQAKGLDARAIILHHIMPNTLRTLLKSTVPATGMLFSNLVIVEYLFYRQGIVSGLFYAMGSRGADAPYAPPSGNPLQTQYYPFDASLVLAYLVVCAAAIGLCWIAVRMLLARLGYRGQVNPYSSSLHQAASHQRMPWQLMLGAAMVVIVLVLGAAANHLHLPNPEETHFLIQNAGRWVAPPFPMSPQHWLGTDGDGRDLLSRAVHFTLPTFGYVGVTVWAVLIVATVLAICASILKVRALRFLLHTWSTYVTVIPGIIGALLILEIPNLYWIGFHATDPAGYWSSSHSVVFLGVLCFLECGRVAYQLQAVLDDAQKKEYMEAAEISGNSTWTKFLLHYLPPLRGAIIEQGMVEFSRVLLLISTLGFFQLGILQSWVVTATDGMDLVATSHDWGALFSQNSRDLLGTSWILFAPAMFVTWTVIGMNLMVTGFRMWINSVPGVRRRQRWPWGLRVAAWGRKGTHIEVPVIPVAESDSM